MGALDDIYDEDDDDNGSAFYDLKADRRERRRKNNRKMRVDGAGTRDIQRRIIREAQRAKGAEQGNS